MAVYAVKTYGKKRQPDHRCPVCGRYFPCHLYVGMPPCTVPHEVQCGNCGLKLHQMAMQIHADELAKIAVSNLEVAAAASLKKKAARKKKK